MRPNVRHEAALHDAVTGCAPSYGVTGQVRVHVNVDDDGGIGNLHTDRQDEAFDRCAGAQLASLRFPRGQRGRTLVFLVETP